MSEWGPYQLGPYSDVASGNGRCVMHNADEAPPAEYEMDLPIGNRIGLCAPCCAWWRADAERPDASPQERPVAIRSVRR